MHDNSSNSGISASVRHNNMLLDSLNLVKNLHLRTAIVFSVGGQLNISKQSTTTSCDFVSKIF